MKFRLICIVGLALLLATINVAALQAEAIVWNTQGYGDGSVGQILGNSGANNGVCTQLGFDSEHTLTITAAGASGTIQSTSGTTQGIAVGDAWLSDGEWFDLIFTLTGPDAGSGSITLTEGSLSGWFNRLGGGDDGENLDLGIPGGAADHYGTVGYGDLVYNGYFRFDPTAPIVIPLGEEIRFNVRYTDGTNWSGWHDGMWVVHQLQFATVPVPEPSTAAMLCIVAVGLLLSARRRFFG